MFFLWLHHFLTLSTQCEKKRIAEKGGGLPVFDNDILNACFMPTAEITAQPLGKIGMHTPAAEGLMVGRSFFSTSF